MAQTNIGSLILKRNLSRGLPELTQKPIAFYGNAQTDKERIFKDNADKSFVYRWTNKLNNKQYIGSATNGQRRLLTYYNLNELKRTNMRIYKALLKYGHESFSFEIIEYCDKDKAVSREQFYLDHFDFEYNYLEKANSVLGLKHSSAVLEKMKGRKNALGLKHSDDTKNKLRISQLNKKHSIESKNKMKEVWAQRKMEKLLTQPTSLLEGGNILLTNNKSKLEGKSVIITNIETNVTTPFVSITEAASVLNITRVTLRSYAKNNTVFSVLKPIANTNEFITEKYTISIVNK